MRVRLFLGSLAVVLPIAAVAGPLGAAERQGERSMARKPAVARTVADKAPRRVENEYTARANQHDPGGDYKAYPDWARAALGGAGRCQH